MAYKIEKTNIDALIDELALRLSNLVDECPKSVEYWDWPELQQYVEEARETLGKVAGGWHEGEGFTALRYAANILGSMLTLKAYKQDA